MNKSEIKEKIKTLNSSEEIKQFVVERLNELEEASEEKFLGQNYDHCFKDYIAKKSHFKAMDKIFDEECADLIIDDETPYIELVEQLKKYPDYKGFLITHLINYEVNNYLYANEPASNWTRGSYYQQGSISIKTVREKQLAVCAEKAALTQNLFKFIGEDVELLAGYRNNEPHMYNLYYPGGNNDNYYAVLIDTSNPIHAMNGDKRVSLPFYKFLSKDQVENLKNGENISFDLENTFTDLKNNYKTDFDFIDSDQIYEYSVETLKNVKVK